MIPAGEKRRPARKALAVAAGLLVLVGGFLVAVPAGPTLDGSPSWSPDGSKIVFYSERDGNSEIYVMEADGSDQTRLTRDPASDGYPSFSPDGRLISFDSNRDGDFDIWVMGADGSEPHPLTDDPARDVSAAWSPDGRRIAFMSDRTGQFEVWIMDSDGSNPVQATDFGTNWFPQWSPDGDRLAYHVGRDVHLLDVGEGRYARLTIDPDNGMYPSWSPDGERIAFMSWRTGSTELYLMDADGSDQRRLTETERGDAIDPRWSPDGERIVLVHVPEGLSPGGPRVIYALDLGSGSVRRLSRRDRSSASLRTIFRSPVHVLSEAADGARLDGGSPGP